MKYSLRLAEPSDDAFLRTLYASTREEEMAAWGWDEAQQTAFLNLQFSARERQYQNLYAETLHQIILANGQPIGRLLVGNTETEICLVDIALLPTHRGGGIGSALLESLQDQARRDQKTLVLSVTKENRAAALYRRLGFEIVHEDDLYLRMQWGPHQD